MSTDWRQEIERSGYYPGLVIDAVASALGDESAEAFVVHHEATFDPAMEMRRHITVLLLTATRLIVCHTDDHPADEPGGRPHASTTTDANQLGNIQSVALTRVVSDPANYAPGTLPSEAVLTIGLSVNWGSMANIDLEPASCSDDSCELDHGYTGAITAEPLTVRVSQAADGAESVANLLHFTSALSAATGR
ncbi:phosphodiesterase [Streptomonospora sp. NEAU-YY374]|nr:phosphodiesterase [Streptomonospora nanhaiensis]MBX9390029.1 phosphodiesterase [Streptomonospora nanhaiensis]